MNIMKKGNSIFAFLTCATVVMSSCMDEGDITYARYFTNGKQVYEAHCQNCHGPSGEGLASLIPPLTDSVFLSKNKHRLSCSIKQGTSDTLYIQGKFFDTAMPANDKLSDGDIAAVITFITNSFGNKQGLYKEDLVKKDLEICGRISSSHTAGD